MAEENDDGGCSMQITGIGGILAAFLSYALNGSFWWAVFHFFCGWIYVIWALIFRFHDIVNYFK